MALIRRINLAEVLKDELEAAGHSLPDDLTHEQLESWTEEQIKVYYAANGKAPFTAKTAEAAAVVTGQDQQLTQQQQQLSKLSFPPKPSPAAFKAWFPGLGLSRTAASHPRAVIICFHSSGTAEDMYTSEGTGSRRTPSPLLEACRQHGWQLLAAQLPGRGLRAKEAPLPTLQEVAKQLLPLVGPVIADAGGKYSFVGHSMGCWAAYELLLLLLQKGFPEPAAACFSAMPWPHIPMEQRPWRQQKLLSEEEFQAECRAWGINEAVFSPGMWEMYQPMLRADFKLFDEYIPSSSSSVLQRSSNNTAFGYSSSENGHITMCGTQSSFQFPMRLFWGSQDTRVTPGMVQEWESYTTGKCKESCITGGHLFPLQPAAKLQWLQEITEACTGALLV